MRFESLISPAFIGWILLSLAQISRAEETARFAGGDGHVAMRSDESFEWRVLRPAEPLSSACHLRTSPIGVGQIHLLDGKLSLCPNSQADVRFDNHTIQLHQGKLRLVVTESADVEWRVEVGGHAIVCRAGSEVVVSPRAETPEIHVLQGVVRIPRESVGQLLVSGPRSDALAGDSRADSKAPDQADAWVQVVRAATEPKRSQGLGQLLTRDAQSDSPVRLDIARYHVNVVLQPPVALVQIDQSFFNPFQAQQENALKAYEQMQDWQPERATDLLQAHAVLMAGLIDHPGRWRKGNVGIIHGSLVAHVAPPADRVLHLMQEVLDFLATDSSAIDDWHFVNVPPRWRPAVV